MAINVSFGHLSVTSFAASLSDLKQFLIITFVHSLSHINTLSIITSVYIQLCARFITFKPKH